LERTAIFLIKVIHTVTKTLEERFKVNPVRKDGALTSPFLYNGIEAFYIIPAINSVVF
jgi:hypothetical protein